MFEGCAGRKCVAMKSGFKLPNRPAYWVHASLFAEVARGVAEEMDGWSGACVFLSVPCISLFL